jgi:hydrogenase nickel incorporation protein HypA/HybF
MHETTLARDLLRVALEKATEAGAARVTAVRGWVAETETLAPESLQLHFEAHARGTAAEGARLELDVRHVAARCAGCSHEYLPEHHLLLCPECASTEAELLGEVGLGLTEVEVA